MRTLLVRGLLAGLIAGIAAAVFAYFIGEPNVDSAIAFEEGGAAAEESGHSHGDEAEEGHSHGEAEVSRGIQSTLGLLVANLGIGVAYGGLFAVAFALVNGRFGAAGPRAYAALLGAGGFVAAGLVPFLKYPANPPGVGDPTTVGTRTELTFSFLGISIIAAGLAIAAARTLTERLGGWLAAVTAAVGYVIVVGAVGLLLPTVNEVPDDFPATLLWDFRLSSLGTLVVLWTVLAAAFGALVHQSARSKEPVAA